MEGDESDSGSDRNRDSKKHRLKNALSRTKTKFTRKDSSAATYALSDDVNDFLAAGRNSTSNRPSIDGDGNEVRRVTESPDNLKQRSRDNVYDFKPANREIQAPIDKGSSNQKRWNDHDRKKNTSAAGIDEFLSAGRGNPPKSSSLDFDPETRYQQADEHKEEEPKTGTKSHRKRPSLVDAVKSSFAKRTDHDADVQSRSNNDVADFLAGGRHVSDADQSASKPGKAKLWKKSDFAHNAQEMRNREVQDFLAAGRTQSSSRPSSAEDTNRIGGSRSIQRPSQPSPINFPTGVQPEVPQSQPSPRRAFVPRIDVSQSQRWPEASSVNQQAPRPPMATLRPEYSGRSQSTSSFSKGRGRARGLSVTFIETPPVIIGEGGDEAMTPPNEISKAKAKARARSVSPLPSRAIIPDAIILRRKPLPSQKQSDSTEVDFQPRPLQRIQTGLNSIPISKIMMDKEFEMSLNSASPSSSTDSPILHRSQFQVVPKQLPAPIQPPPIQALDSQHTVKHTLPSKDLRLQFEEGVGDFQNPFNSHGNEEANGILPVTRRRESPDRIPRKELPYRGRASEDQQRFMSPQIKPSGNWL